jgi:hypothetical protein
MHEWMWPFVFRILFSLAYKGDIIKQCLPNLHSLGELLLPCFLRQLFTLTVLLSLYVLFIIDKCLFCMLSKILFLRLCVLISYALAGSQAFAALFNVEYVIDESECDSFMQSDTTMKHIYRWINRYATMIPVFCWTWTLLIVFFHAFIQPIISVLTFLKGTLFSVTVCSLWLMNIFLSMKISIDEYIHWRSFLHLWLAWKFKMQWQTIFRPWVIHSLWALLLSVSIDLTMTIGLFSILLSGGLMNVMPLMFSKLKQTRDEVIKIIDRCLMQYRIKYLPIL